jgi:tetratricopeptide (TPR) repeat protein
MLGNRGKIVDKNKQALQKLQENKIEEASQLFIAHTEEQPDDPVGYINVGNMLGQLGQIKEAERFFLKAIQLDELAATAYYGLGNLYYEAALYEEANKMLTHASSLGLLESDVFYLLGMTHMKREQYMLAVPFLQRAVELHREIDTLFQYGLSLAKTSYIQEAKEIFREVVEKSVDHVDALYNLGVIAVHQNQVNLSRTYFEKVLALDEKHILARNALLEIEGNEEV